MVMSASRSLFHAPMHESVVDRGADDLVDPWPWLGTPSREAGQVLTEQSGEGARNGEQGTFCP